MECDVCGTRTGRTDYRCDRCGSRLCDKHESPSDHDCPGEQEDEPAETERSGGSAPSRRNIVPLHTSPSPIPPAALWLGENFLLGVILGFLAANFGDEALYLAPLVWILSGVLLFYHVGTYAAKIVDYRAPRVEPIE